MARQARKLEWQQFSYQPYEFNHQADFCTVKSVTNENLGGKSSPQPVKLARLHYATRNQTITDRYAAAGTDYQDTVMIVIRHNKDTTQQKTLYVVLDNNKIYKCINYSVNDGTYNATDLLTLKHVERFGK